MTVTELIAEFRTTYDLGSLGLPGFEDDEIKQMLDIQMFRAISQKIGGNNVYKSKFPESKKRIEDLQNLMKVGSPIVATTTKGYKLVILPDDYLQTVELMVEHSDGTVEDGIQIDYFQVSRFQNSKRNEEAYIKNPVYLFDKNGTENAIRLYVDSSYTEEYAVRLVYITQPTQTLKLVGDSEELIDFTDTVYHEIVAMTVDQAILIATPNKSQINQQNLNKIE